MVNKSPDTGRLDAILFFDPGEALALHITNALTEAGRIIYAPAADWARTDDVQTIQARMAMATTVVVFIDRRPWEPHVSLLLGQAVLDKRRIVIVLLCEDYEVVDAEARNLLRSHTYLKVDETSWRSSLPALLAAVPNSDDRHSAIIAFLEGDDEDKAQALRRLVVTGESPAEDLLADMVYLLEQELAPGEPVKIAVRDVASARSWLLAGVLALGGQRPDLKPLFRRHIDPHIQTSVSVRFWLLANAIDLAPAVAPELAARAQRDSAPQVRLLAELYAIGDPAVIRERLESELSSEDPNAALLYMRVRPHPDLLALVAARLPEPELTHAVLNALTQKIPPSVAAEVLLAQFQVPVLVDLIVSAAETQNRAARRRSGQLLSAFPAEERNRALSVLSRESGLANPVIDELQRWMQSPIDVRRAVMRIAGFQSDTIEVAADYLDIARDVETLTAVVLARDVDPPLAIGLFGDWGSGKSFFMQSMQQAASRISAMDTERFCTDVVQIPFNAWHYADGNLLVSLVSHILETLSGHLSPALNADARQAALIEELESARIEARQLASEQTAAVAVVAQQETRLKTIQFERETAEIKLTQLRAKDLERILGGNAVLKSQLHEALVKLGAPAALTQVDDLNEVVRQTRTTGGRLIALIASLTRGKNLWLSLLLVVLAIGLPLALDGLAGLIELTLAPAVTWTAALLTLLGGGAGMIQAALRTVSGHLTTLEGVKRRVDDALAEKRRTPTPEERQLHAELAKLMGEEESLAVRLRAAEERVAGLEQKIAELKDSRSLKRFLMERTQSEDYRKHLGVIGTIRRDFEALTERLQAKEDGRLPVDRIVLYIDDLDRCPAGMVVQVLEAVHMLLAFKLFVVVVGVDPRWLAHALSSEHAALAEIPAKEAEDTEDAAPDRRATPQDFLEKIFQIPFALRPMTHDGFDRLMTALFRPSEAATPAPSLSVDAPSTAAIDDADGALIARDLEEVSPANLHRVLAPSRLPAQIDPELLLNIERLNITGAEARFAATLRPFFASPRAAKRFTNTYRLLKAQSDEADFKGSADANDASPAWQVPMILLALVISREDGAKRILDLLESLPDRSAGARRQWRADLTQTRAPSEVIKAVTTMLEARGLDETIDRLHRWLPRVLRYSFEGRR